MLQTCEMLFQFKGCSVYALHMENSVVGRVEK